MKNIKKTLFVAIGLLVCCASLPGCGGSSGGGSGGGEAIKPETFAPRPPAESSPEGGGAPGKKAIPENLTDG